MTPLWSYFWPIFAAGLVVGAIAGSIAFRRKERAIPLGAGAVAALVLAALWHGPMGAADRFAFEVQRDARVTLDRYEMVNVRARLGHAPLTRRIQLSGVADDFQRGELVRIIGDLPGVSSATWSKASGGLPLIVEGAAVSAVGYSVALVLAYLVLLRRRYNAQWKW